MEHRSLSLAALLILLLPVAGPAFAEDEIGTPEQRADWTQRLARARELADDADAREKAAKQRRTDKDAECPARFRVNACYDENRREYSAVVNEARRLDNQAKAIEREVRREQLNVKEIRREADSARREAELPEREAQTAAARQKAAERESAVRADKAQRAEVGQQRRAAEDERLRQKQAAHAARVAEKMNQGAAAAPPAGTAKPQP